MSGWRPRHQVVEERLAGIALDAVRGVEQAQRRGGDHGLLDRDRGVALGCLEVVGGVSGRSRNGPAVRRGSWRVWPSANGMMTPSGGQVGQPVDRVGDEAGLGLLAVA